MSNDLFYVTFVWILINNNDGDNGRFMGCGGNADSTSQIHRGNWLQVLAAAVDNGQETCLDLDRIGSKRQYTDQPQLLSYHTSLPRPPMVNKRPQMKVESFPLLASVTNKLNSDNKFETPRDDQKLKRRPEQHITTPVIQHSDSPSPSKTLSKGTENVSSMMQPFLGHVIGQNPAMNGKKCRLRMWQTFDFDQRYAKSLPYVHTGIQITDRIAA